MVHLIQSQSLIKSPILGNLNIAPQLQEEDAVGQSDDSGPQDPDVVGLDVDDEDGDEEHEEEVEHVEEAAKAPGHHIFGNQLLLGERSEWKRLPREAEEKVG